MLFLAPYNSTEIHDIHRHDIHVLSVSRKKSYGFDEVPCSLINGTMDFVTDYLTELSMY